MKIFCVGRNYADHAAEMNSPKPDSPIVFLKPDTSLLRKNQPYFLPDFSDEIHHEIEIVVKINRVGKNISEKFAHRYYSEIGLGIDITARDIQQKCKEKGLPWELSKAFDNSAPISKVYPIERFGDLSNIEFSLNKNGNTVQKGNTNEMIFSIDQLITYISKFFTIKMGDLIFTGTPAGVGKLKIGDHLQAYLSDEKMMDFFIK